MGHHIDPQGRFQSDRHPKLPPDKIVLSFNDRHARAALRRYVLGVRMFGGDGELADDIERRLDAIAVEEDRHDKI